ncbi:MAG: polysaccharide pyruvyl transferase family protein [Nostoc sp. TH1S01]|nr:polysaccharide pyruvyl transferase family protein [Nostoc sp. TH1S01]
MKVGIWGSYNYGNYGDDLMAIKFASELKKMSVEPWVYRLDTNLAQRYQIHTTHSIKELFENTKFCIIGGGGMLTECSAAKVDFEELDYAVTSNQCPLFPISVGSNGQEKNTTLPLENIKLWQNPYCQTSTVRLLGDVALVEKLGNKAIYYPDVLLSISDLWDIKPLPKSSTQLHVGINIGKSLSRSFILSQLSWIAEIKKDIVFHFISTNLPNSSYRNHILPHKESDYIKSHIYTDPISTLKFLKSLDLLVSSKLHLGLTALSLNTPFYSYGGTGKTKAFLKSINAEFAIFNSKNIIDLFKVITNPSEVIQAKKKFDFNKLEEEKVLSKGHIKFLKQVIQTC